MIGLKFKYHIVPIAIRVVFSLAKTFEDLPVADCHDGVAEECPGTGYGGAVAVLVFRG